MTSRSPPLAMAQEPLQRAHLAASPPQGRHRGLPGERHARVRHYYASVLLQGGVDIRRLSEYLGHHNPAFTLRVYAHLMPDAEERTLRAIESALSPDGPEETQEAEEGK